MTSHIFSQCSSQTLRSLVAPDKRYEALESGAQGEGEVVYGFFGHAGEFVLGAHGAHGAHGGSEEAGVEGGFGKLFAGAVLLGGLLGIVLCALEPGYVVGGA